MSNYSMSFKILKKNKVFYHSALTYATQYCTGINAYKIQYTQRIVNKKNYSYSVCLSYEMLFLLSLRFIHP